MRWLAKLAALVPAAPVDVDALAMLDRGNVADDRATRELLAHAPRDPAGFIGLDQVVDYRLVPRRLSPGFELRLSRRSIAAGYLAFGLGLALAGMGRAEQRLTTGRRSLHRTPTCEAPGRRRPS